MLTRQRAQELFAEVTKYSTADETECLITANRYALTRFANNNIHQNVTEEGLYLSVRAVADHRTARAGTNKLDSASIRRLAEAALDLARFQPPDPELLRMPEPQMYRAVQRFVPATAELGPRERAEAVRSCIEQLPLDFREGIMLREMEQLSYEEIAEITGVPPGTVMSRLSRARARLSQCLRLRLGYDDRTMKRGSA